ncbi:MAG: polyprenyl synthetase family protein [Spirochaetia bacterium]|nr:polyprenyl synthetase family protein [Spirochaetia bacterium]
MNGFWKDEPSLEEQLRQVRSLILTSIEQSNHFIKDILSDRVTTGGKMIRPALVLIGSKLGRSDREEEVLRIASVLEMIHLASLVHDDIIDGAKTRRGIPTINAIIGPKKAVLAGDYLLSKAMALVKGKEGDLEATAVANAFSRLCESELNQDAGEGDFLISKSTYIRRIAGKTASLFALSAYAGAAVAMSEPSKQHLLHRIGYCLGIAFQIQDDILDYTGDAKSLGKEIGQDVQIGVPTYPLIAALIEEKQNTSQKKPLYELVKNKKKLSKRESEKVVKLALSLGGAEKAEHLARTYINRALHDIDTLDNPEAQRLLISLYNKLAKRNN